MKTFIRLAIAIAAVGGAGLPAQGRIQPQMFCWSSDVEFPVACEEEEDEDDQYRPAAALVTSDRAACVAFLSPPDLA
jgi:hypothetical protein